MYQVRPCRIYIHWGMWLVHIHANECEEHGISSIVEFGSIADHNVSANLFGWQLQVVNVFSCFAMTDQHFQCCSLAASNAVAVVGAHAVAHIK